jgi:hypothetical protein
MAKGEGEMGNRVVGFFFLLTGKQNVKDQGRGQVQEAGMSPSLLIN